MSDEVSPGTKLYNDDPTLKKSFMTSPQIPMSGKTSPVMIVVGQRFPDFAS